MAGKIVKTKKSQCKMEPALRQWDPHKNPQIPLYHNIRNFDAKNERLQYTFPFTFIPLPKLCECIPLFNSRMAIYPDNKFLFENMGNNLGKEKDSLTIHAQQWLLSSDFILVSILSIIFLFCSTNNHMR